MFKANPFSHLAQKDASFFKLYETKSINFHKTMKIINSGNAIGMAAAMEESILVGRTLTMETILCLIKAS